MSAHAVTPTKTSYRLLQRATSREKPDAEEHNCGYPRAHSADLPQGVSDLTDQLTWISPQYFAAGGFSDIYEGHWTRVETTSCSKEDAYTSPPVQTRVAIKLLRVFTQKNPEWDRERAMMRLNREVLVWQLLEHPNIAKFYGVSFKMGGRPSMVMKFYCNGTAARYLEDKPEDIKISVIKNIADGLAYLHDHEPCIIHGDLKGSNVLITDDGRGVLSDFGLAKILAEVSPTGYTTSTSPTSVRWQAPETIQDQRVSKLNPGSDVWSFGCTGYELLHGKVPYLHADGSSREDHIPPNYWVLSNNVLDPAVSPVHPDDEEAMATGRIGRVLRHCWVRDPYNRPRIREIASMLGKEDEPCV